MNTWATYPALNFDNCAMFAGLFRLPGQRSREMSKAHENGQA
ncbi:hypothetical protein Z945_3608 [Sulfitobacter noctilucae]|nr:hypothetical protein Z945_3608 [Sulfitobacter noctilucae]